VEVEKSGQYALSFRVASDTEGGRFHITAGGKPLGSRLNVPNTGGEQKWVILKNDPVQLNEGSHRFRLVTEVGGYRLSWMEARMANAARQGDGPDPPEE